MSAQTGEQTGERFAAESMARFRERVAQLDASGLAFESTKPELRAKRPWFILTYQDRVAKSGNQARRRNFARGVVFASQSLRLGESPGGASPCTRRLPCSSYELLRTPVGTELMSDAPLSKEDQERLEDLLDAYERAIADEQEFPVAEVCCEWPHLAAALEENIRLLQQGGRLMKTQH